VDNEEELIKWTEKLSWKGMSWTGFREPDINNQLTAIACLTNDGTFKKLKLIGD
jgi:hypothetical protein